MASSLKDDRNFLLRSTLYNFASTILKVASPAMMVVVARIFGKELFGIYVSTELWVLTLSRIAVLGLDKGMHWYLPQNAVKGRPAYTGIMESFWRASIIAALITAVISAGAFLGLHRFFSGLARLNPLDITLYILSLTPWVMIHVFGGAMEGSRKPQYKMFVSDFAVYTLAPLIALGLFYTGLHGRALPLGLLGSNILGAVAYLFIIRRQYPEMPWFPGHRVSRELLGYAIPLGFSEVVTAFLMRADLWMVLALLGPGDAGIYAVMVTISNGLKTIRQSYTPILLPVVAGMGGGRLKEDLRPVYTYCVSMVTTIQLFIGFFIVIFPGETLMIAGKSFVSRPEVLGILLLGNLVSGMFGMAPAVLNGLGESRFMLLLDAVTLGVALLMNWLLIPRFGLAGAAISTFVFLAFQACWANIHLIRRGLWPYGRSLFIQGGWILALTALYLFINLNGIRWPLQMRIPLYAACCGLLLLTAWRLGLLSGRGKAKT